MFFLGLDTGYARLGYSILNLTQEENKPKLIQCGIVETEANASDGERLLKIESSLNRIVSKKKIVFCALEEVFIRKNLSTGVRLLQARGVILLTLAKNHIPVNSVSPTGMKKMLTGYGSANKRQIQNMVTKLLELKEIPEPDDAADAVALSLCAWLAYKSQSKSIQPS